MPSTTMAAAEAVRAPVSLGTRLRFIFRVGSYQLGSTLNLRVGTLIVGDPINPPVIKAAAGFNGDTLVNGYDSKNGARRPAS